MNSTAHDHPDAPRPSPAEPAASTGDEAGAPEESGRLDVADHVVEKIAGHAVTMVPGASAAPRRVLGVNVGAARPEHAASVSADVHDGIASVEATIAVTWPRSVQAVADDVRRLIRAEVTSLTGVQVDHVDVEVVSMTIPTSAKPRVQ